MAKLILFSALLTLIFLSGCVSQTEVCKVNEDCIFTDNYEYTYADVKYSPCSCISKEIADNGEKAATFMYCTNGNTCSCNSGKCEVALKNG